MRCRAATCFLCQVSIGIAFRFDMSKRERQSRTDIVNRLQQGCFGQGRAIIATSISRFQRKTFAVKFRVSSRAFAALF